jgi:hypothetical protein
VDLVEHLIGAIDDMPARRIDAEAGRSGRRRSVLDERRVEASAWFPKPSGAE